MEAKKRKMVTMRQDGLLKVIKGITAISEIERLTEGKTMMIEEESDAVSG